MQKILTVLIPTYNNNESLKKVLDSYVGDKRIEILVSDDSDNEDKKMLIKAMCKKQILFILMDQNHLLPKIGIC